MTNELTRSGSRNLRRSEEKSATFWQRSFPLTQTEDLLFLILSFDLYLFAGLTIQIDFLIVLFFN